MKEDIERLLSCLWTDANMALNGEWDKSDSGFEAQITLIERFSDKHNITLTKETWEE